MKQCKSRLMSILGIFLLISSFSFSGCDSNDSGSNDAGGAATCSILYNANGGSGTIDSQTAEAGSTIILPDNAPLTAPEEDYEFAGWNTAADGSGKTYAAGAYYTIGSEDVTLYAYWSDNVYTVNLMSDMGGTSSAIFYVVMGDTIVLPVCTFTYILEGYSFSYWKSYNTDVTYTDGAQFTMNEAALGSLPGVYLVANWKQNTISLSFNANGGSGTMESWDVAEGASTALPVSTFTREGYLFTVWNTKADGTGTDYAAGATFTVGTEDVTLYAMWEMSYTVSYDSNGADSGSAPDSADYLDGTTVTLPANSGSLARSGYSFAGWNTKADGTGTTYAMGALITTGTEDVSFYAVWSQNVHSLSFNANEGSGTMESQAITDNSTVVLPANTLTRSTYSFTGWSTSADGEVIYANNSELAMGTEDITLYAVWSRNYHTLTFNANGGTGTMASLTVAEGDTITLPDLGFTREGYTFSNWSSDTGSYEDGAQFTMAVQDVTLYAEWILSSVQIHTSDTTNYTQYGSTVSVDGNYTVTGSTNGNRVYVYENDGLDNWSASETMLQGLDTVEDDKFGFAVDVDGDYIVVGAMGEDGGGELTADDGYSYAGAAYIFKNNGNNTWNQVAELHATDMTAGDSFGYSVCISGDYVIIGATGKGYSDPTSGESYANAGAAYIFKNDGSDNWNQVAALSSSNIQASALFGNTVSISGDHAVVGAKSEDVDSVNGAGAVYVFKNDGSDNWSGTTVLHASDMDSNDYFGSSVAIDGDYIVAGMQNDDEGGTNAGAAYIFKNDGNNNWTESAVLYASDMQKYDKFGYSVSINGKHVIVSANGEDGGVNDPVSSAGAVYIFENDGSDNWIEIFQLHAPDMQAVDIFGYSVSINDEYAVIGATQEDGGEGDPVPNTGAVYVFRYNLE